MALRGGLAFALAAVGPQVSANEVSDSRALIEQGIDFRNQGSLDQSIQTLITARQSADSADARTWAAGELGASLLQARRFDSAEEPLLFAYASASGSLKARFALELGNLAVARKRAGDASRFYQEAQLTAAGNPEVYLAAALNLVRLAPLAERLPQLAALSPEIEKIGNDVSKARYYVNLGNQAREADKVGTALAYQSLDRARMLLADSSPSRLQVEVLDALAQLYEDRDRNNDALMLTGQAIAKAGGLDTALVADLLIGLEWRQGRLQKRLGNPVQAAIAYQQAVNYIEAVRQDIPIEYENGVSSFRQTLEPIYLGLAELLLQEAEGLSTESRPAYLRRAKDTIELIKQAELQDFLGDRCSVEVVQSASATPPPAGTAVLYPVLGSDRIELIMETDRGIVHRRIAVDVAAVRQKARSFASDLRNGEPGYQANARQLYDWLLRPFDQVFAEQGIQTLVVVPDGALRLVAFGALHDGSRFAIEKFAVSTATGLSMTNTSPPAGKAFVSLISGVAYPGSVVEKLSRASFDRIADPNMANASTPTGIAATRSLRRVRASATDFTPAVGADRSRQVDVLRQALALPGVKDEVQAVSRILNGETMLDGAFTVDQFRQHVVTGEYGIVHVASHGVFGGSADSSYILAYDDLLTMGGLQSLLKSDQFRSNPLELLTLSACETAEGDDRSPLGISGAALKARAKSVLGTLWPVEDNSARMIMEKFYTGLASKALTKTEALRQAQVELIRSGDFAHPFFWAPFTLIGNWL